jgi:hypothetical protein
MMALTSVSANAGIVAMAATAKRRPTKRLLLKDISEYPIKFEYPIEA